MKMLDAASRQAVEEGKRRLREFLEASDTGRQAIAMSASAAGNSTRAVEEYELSSLSSSGKTTTKEVVQEEDDDDL